MIRPTVRHRAGFGTQAIQLVCVAKAAFVMSVPTVGFMVDALLQGSGKSPSAGLDQLV